MKIIKFEAENVKRLRAVEITPDGAVVMIGGKNGHGKSSVLDSIMAALGGKKYEDVQMVRGGKKKGKVEIDLGDIVVRRTFTASGGGVLTVTSADGTKLTSPQAVLDSLIGAISFDPLLFSKSSDHEQAEIIKQLAGLDLTDLEVERLEHYNERTLVNRETKRLEQTLEQQTFNDDEKYQEEIDTKSILLGVEEQADINRTIDQVRQSITKNEDHNQKNIDRREEIKARIHELQKEIADLTDESKRLQETFKICEELIVKSYDNIEVAKKTLSGAGDLDKQLKNAEDHNQVFKSNQAYTDTKKLIVASMQSAQDLTTKMLDLDQKKDKVIKESQMPINELSFNDDGLLTYQGFPFSQASQAEKIRVSVAIGISMNPKLKVLLIKDGSLLDEDNLKMISKMATVTKAQLWIETVGTRENCSVIMEDGVSKVPDEQSI